VSLHNLTDRLAAGVPVVLLAAGLDRLIRPFVGGSGFSNTYSWYILYMLGLPR
jgi:hypothetical protein